MSVAMALFKNVKILNKVMSLTVASESQVQHFMLIVSTRWQQCAVTLRASIVYGSGMVLCAFFVRIIVHCTTVHKTLLKQTATQWSIHLGQLGEQL